MIIIDDCNDGYDIKRDVYWWNPQLYCKVYLQ
jgi:hypothetical protein